MINNAQFCVFLRKRDIKTAEKGVTSRFYASFGVVSTSSKPAGSNFFNQVSKWVGGSPALILFRFLGFFLFLFGFFLLFL
jgi:hypothetical protein